MNTHGSHWIRPAKRLAIYRRDAFLCAYCQHKVERGNWTLDHIIPRSQGGSNHETNLVTAHVKCNSARGNKLLSPSLYARFISIASVPFTIESAA